VGGRGEPLRQTEATLIVLVVFPLDRLGGLARVPNAVRRRTVSGLRQGGNTEAEGTLMKAYLGMRLMSGSTPTSRAANGRSTLLFLPS
jgi:hypothetical protein